MGLPSARKRLRENRTEWAKKLLSKGKPIVIGIASLWFVKVVCEDVNKLTVAAELVRMLGLACLVYKIGREETCTGLSLKSQLITATFLFVRLYCSSRMHQDVHVLADFVTLVVTLWVLWKMRFKLKSTSSKDLDYFPLLYLLGACAMLAVILHPKTTYPFMYRTLWAFGVYLETIQILPQLDLMQAIRVVERDTAHYVFALGMSRLLNCIHFIVRLVEGDKYLFKIVGPGIWPGTTLICQIVSIFMLGDFATTMS